LDEIAARYDAAGAEDLLMAAETLAEEFGEATLLGAVLAALKNRLASIGSSDTAPSVAPSGQRETRPAYAHMDTAGVASEKGEDPDSTAYVAVHHEAAPGRVSLRSLLSGRRSSTGLIDERQALANCKPLSTAVLSITPQEQEQTNAFEQTSAPPNPRHEATRDHRGATEEATTGPGSPSSWLGDRAGSRSDPSGDDAA
jgi:hypothetical protein